MKLSAPIFQLKRRAKLMARDSKRPLCDALDQIAREEGFARWSALSAHMAAGPLSKTILSRLEDGDLLLLASRRGHGKTTLGIQLLLEAARAGRPSVLFTLEMTEAQARRHIRSLDDGTPQLGDRIDVVTSDNICADYVAEHLAGTPRGTVAVIDYLQLLDQQRSKPALAEQLSVLKAFADRTGVVLGFLSQIDRAFDQQQKRLPDIGDVRLPNLVDLGMFSKACFLHDGEAQLQNVA